MFYNLSSLTIFVYILLTYTDYANAFILNITKITYSTTLKLCQRFETYDEFLSGFNIESKKNFDIWTKIDSRRHKAHTNISNPFTTINPIVI